MFLNLTFSLGIDFYFFEEENESQPAHTRGGIFMLKKRKKITVALFHCGFIYTGGGERIVIEEILGLRKKGYEVDCYVPTYDPQKSYPDIIQSLGIKTFLPQLPRFVPLRFATQMVASCLVAPLLVWRFLKYDVFLGANQPGAFMAWIMARLLNKPYYVYLSQPNRILYPRDHENWQNVRDYYFLNKIINQFFKPMVRWLDTKSITSGENLFINGSFVAQEICRIYKPKKWIDCPGGAHPSPKKVVANNRFTGGVHIDHHTLKKPYILFTSRHEPWKKFEWAIEVMALVLKKYPDVRLAIPGEMTTLTPELVQLAKDLGIEKQVDFIGAINQVSLQKLYQHAAVYIFPSMKEDLGIVVQEAQAAGVPVVAWNVGGPTVTIVNKKTGFLIEPYSLPRMEEKIVFLLKNRRKRAEMGRLAWQHIQRNFTWEVHCDILEKEIQKMIS